MLAPSRLLKIGKHEVAACLSWQMLPGIDGVSPKAEVREVAKENVASYGAFYENPGSRYHVVGLVGAEKPSPFVNKPALAAWLAERVEKRLIYLEAMDPRGSNYYLVSVLPGAIDPRTDRIVTDDEATQLISAMLDELYQADAKGIDFVLGGDVPPPSSNMLERHPPRKGSLDEFLEGAPPKPLRVKQLLGIAPAAVYTAMAVVAGVLLMVGGAVWWKQHQAKLELDAQMAAMLAQAQAQQQTNVPGNLAEMRMQQALADQLALDSQTFTPSDFLHACQASQRRLVPSMGGWTLTTIVCDPANGTAIGTYSRVSNSSAVGGTNNSFFQAAHRAGFNPLMDFAQETVTISVPLDGLVKRPGLTVAQLPPRSLAAVQIPTQFQALALAVPDAHTTVGAPAAVDVKYNDPAKAKDPPEQQMVSVPPERSYLKGAINLVSSSPWVLNAMNMDWANLTIARLSMRAGDAGQEEWTLEATYLVANG